MKSVCICTKQTSWHRIGDTSASLMEFWDKEEIWGGLLYGPDFLARENSPIFVNSNINSVATVYMLASVLDFVYSGIYSNVFFSAIRCFSLHCNAHQGLLYRRRDHLIRLGDSVS